MGNWISAAAKDARQDFNTVLGYQYQGSQARKGMRYDRRQERHFYNTARQRGLTPQEYYGSPAAGGNTTAGAQVMGNAHSQMMGQLADSEGIMQAAQMRNAKNIANIQKDATLGAAGKSADAQVRIEQIKDNFRRDQLGMDRGTYQDRKQVTANEAANSMPEWVRRQVILKMGPDNMIIGALADKYNLDLSSAKSIQNAPDSVLVEFFKEVLKQTAKTGREAEGIKKIIKDLIDWAKSHLPDNRAKGESWIQKLQNYLSRDFQHLYDHDGNRIIPSDSYPQDAQP